MILWRPLSILSSTRSYVKISSSQFLYAVSPWIIKGFQVQDGHIPTSSGIWLLLFYMFKHLKHTAIPVIQVRQVHKNVFALHLSSQSNILSFWFLDWYRVHSTTLSYCPTSAAFLLYNNIIDLPLISIVFQFFLCGIHSFKKQLLSANICHTLCRALGKP